ncbi:MAG: protein phosphatase 2C domain-containing protein [Lachnospiraceae bacterium]|nr:protein phosphatase 2C domain-containing protein [Lachnospiraceae bacterium]
MWNSVQCAVQGRGHIKTGTPCQDKTYFMFDNDVSVIALADGAGSAFMSHFGAKFVTHKICELLTQQFDIYFNEDDGVAIKRVIVGILLEGLEKLAEYLNCETKDLASTLLVAAVYNGKYIILHIGDGVIGYVKDNELKIASHPENGEFVNTTVFVTSKDALPTMKMMKGQLNGITGFALMSDGTEASLYNKREKSLAPVLKKIMDLSQTMRVDCLQNEIERSFENVIKNSTTDDCSLIILVEEDYSFRGYRYLNESKKRAYLGIVESICARKRIKRYDNLLDFLNTPKDLSQISKYIFLRKKYCRKHIDLLMKRNMVIAQDGRYRTAIILDKE